MSGESIQAEKKEKVILDKLWSQMHNLKYVLLFITIHLLITDTANGNYSADELLWNSFDTAVF